MSEKLVPYPQEPSHDADPGHEDYDDSGQHSPTASELNTKPEGAALEPVKSQPSINNVASIPDGGWSAWAQVAGGFFLMFNSWGIVNTFGAYQTFYESGELFSKSTSTVAWIGAVQACLLLLVGAVTGPIYDAGHFRWLIGTGSFLIVFGHMMLSLCHTFWQCLLAQAFCVGIGCGLIFVPGVAIISTYFKKKLALAIGISASGSSLGGLIYPIVFHNLQTQIGFGWSTRVIGFIALATLAVSNTIMRMRVKPANKRALVDKTAFRDTSFILHVLASTVGFCGLYMPFFYIQYFGIVSQAVDANLGFYLLAILNAASVFGRIVPNFFADRLGALNTMIPSVLIAGMLCLLLIVGASKAGTICISLFYGFFSGTFVSLPPAIIVSLTANRSMIGTRMGMAFSVNAIGVLIGTPIGGAILGASNTPGVQPSYDQLNFTGVWIFGGVLVLMSGLFFICCRVSKTGLQLMAVA